MTEKSKKSKSAHAYTTFGRCTSAASLACKTCPTAKGRAACVAAATTGTLSPRVRSESRPYTKWAQAAARWRLGKKHQGMKALYDFLVSWTMDGSDLVYQRTAQQLAAGHGIGINTFYRYIGEMQKLGLAKKFRRGDVTEDATREDEKAYLMLLPNWAVEIAELVNEITDHKNGGSIARLEKKLAAKQAIVLLALEADPGKPAPRVERTAPESDKIVKTKAIRNERGEVVILPARRESVVPPSGKRA